MNNSSSKSVVDNVLKSLSKKFNHLSRVFSGLKKLKEARHICSHFSSFLEPVVANNSTLKTEVFKIRHHVYCEELGFEKIRENGQETDEFDAFSQYCLIRHRSSGQLAGTVRLVTPKHSGEQLPIEKYCLDSITNPSLNPSNFPREQICEISRLAVPRAFRRRQMDNFDGAATGVINTHTFSDTELRCFPFIAVGLYFTAASLAMSQNIKHAYVMMEPRLARRDRKSVV